MFDGKYISSVYIIRNLIKYVFLKVIVKVNKKFKCSY